MMTGLDATRPDVTVPAIGRRRALPSETQQAPADDARLRGEIAAMIPNLKRYARSLKRDAAEADDLVQECLCRVLTKIHLWQRGSDLRAWTFTILHNQHINDLRRSARQALVMAAEETAPTLSTTSDAVSLLQARDLERAIHDLPDPQRQALLLVGLYDIDYVSAAKMLGIPLGTLRSRLFRARETLRKSMEMGSVPLPLGALAADAHRWRAEAVSP